MNRIRLSRYIILFALPILLFSCVSVKQISSAINKSIQNEAKISEPIKLDYFNLNTTKLAKMDTLSKVKKLSTYFVPAVFFWAWDRTYKCEVNNEYFVNVFSTLFKQKAEEFKLQKFLGDKKLEISLDAVPSTFIYTNNGTVLFVVVAYSYNFSEYVYSKDQKFKMSYKIKDGDNVVRADTFSFKLEDRYANVRYTTYDLVYKYMDVLKWNFSNKSSEFIERIIEDL